MLPSPSECIISPSHHTTRGAPMSLRCLWMFSTVRSCSKGVLLQGCARSVACWQWQNNSWADDTSGSLLLWERKQRSRWACNPPHGFKTPWQNRVLLPRFTRQMILQFRVWLAHGTSRALLPTGTLVSRHCSELCSLSNENSGLPRINDLNPRTVVSAWKGHKIKLFS